MVASVSGLLVFLALKPPPTSALQPARMTASAGCAGEPPGRRLVVSAAVPEGARCCSGVRGCVSLAWCREWPFRLLGFVRLFRRIANQNNQKSLRVAGWLVSRKGNRGKFAMPPTFKNKFNICGLTPAFVGPEGRRWAVWFCYPPAPTRLIPHSRTTPCGGRLRLRARSSHPASRRPACELFSLRSQRTMCGPPTRRGRYQGSPASVLRASPLICATPRLLPQIRRQAIGAVLVPLAVQGPSRGDISRLTRSRRRRSGAGRHRSFGILSRARGFPSRADAN